MPGEADEALRVAGFVPCGEMPEDGADDEDGILCPPPYGSPDGSPDGSLFGGGIRNTLFSESLLGSSALPIKLWSTDGATGNGIGFVCAFDVMKGVFYAKLKAKMGDPESEHSMKGAINTLFDIAEVVPPCEAPFINAALLLDFDLGWPSHSGFQSEYACTADSDCSTSADEEDYQFWSDSDSN